ncbi:urease accessory protein UreE [Limibaculum sp. FT325]|uniref:urease accessory protein UreE n=1 Tax=Thermohalobaculum sediminis TaxID=2939436 RepID=UPI0020C07814|nr:urease accessory protein UreE [Limibaculum sediminis]MCL5777940.1 urease accessory protein UreE [Limibaculum sediminis]
MRATRLTPAAVAPTASVTLSHDERYRRRGLLTTDQGEEVLLDLPEATELPDGGALVLEDGRHVLIRAAPEVLCEVRGTDPHHLLRLCWHLGNRHLPVAVGTDRLLIRHDHVIEDMLTRLGATVRPVTEPFHPEGGAYGHGRTHGHSHAHDPHADPNAHIPHRHGHGHDHGHDHE